MKPKGLLQVLMLFFALSNLSLTAQQFSNPLYFSASIGDKISLYDNRLNSHEMYGFGVESSTLYYKALINHRWYLGKNADDGANSTMQLDIQVYQFEGM